MIKNTKYEPRGGVTNYSKKWKYLKKGGIFKLGDLSG